MKPYGEDYFKHKSILRSNSKKAKLVAKNADRSKKKSIRNKIKLLITKEIPNKIDP